MQSPVDVKWRVIDSVSRSAAAEPEADDWESVDDDESDAGADTGAADVKAEEAVSATAGSAYGSGSESALIPFIAWLLVLVRI